MSEVLRELVVALSLDSDNFSRNLRTINNQIKEAESTFRLAGAGVTNFEKTVQGTESKLSMLGKNQKSQSLAVEQYSRALVQANGKLTDSAARQDKMKGSLEQARVEYTRLQGEVASAGQQYNSLRASLGDADSATIAAKQNLDQYKTETRAARDKVTLLEGQLKSNTKTLQNNADEISKATANLNTAKAALKETEAELKKLTQELYRQQSTWTQAGNGLTAFAAKSEKISKSLVTAGR